jgi:hypothetical protein
MVFKYSGPSYFCSDHLFFLSSEPGIYEFSTSSLFLTENEDSTILEQLDKPNELLSSVWALAKAPSSIPFLSSPPEKSREAKVLEFSKFLAEQEEGLKSGNDIEPFLRHKIPSKI